LAGRAGRWSAQHRKLAIWGWIAFVVAAIAVGGALGTKTLDNSVGDGESARAERTLENGFPQSAVEQVLVQSKGQESIHGLHAKAAVREVETRLGKLPFVHDLTGPYDEGAGGQVSADGRSGLINPRRGREARLQHPRQVEPRPGRGRPPPRPRGVGLPAGERRGVGGAPAGRVRS